MPKTFMDLANEAKSRIKEIDTNAAASALERGGVAVIDVREPEEFRQGHIPGAINIPRGVAEMGVPQAVPDTGTRIIFYCAGGNRSALVADNLKQMGYELSESLIGGFQGWARAGRQVER
ncbi:MAG TPA: rhodanese-like domain-containing protein [Candidatus Polarisedimenticolia bacterium]|nr:rhodanese-like domain-containing protein [Candidatus Polarisedimenticolia bacterium]